MNKSQIRAAWIEWMNQHQPFAATTIHFNSRRDGRPSSRAAAANLEAAKRHVSRIGLALDQLYFNTKHVEDRVSGSDRFEAFCVLEKAVSSPHVHIVWVHRSDAAEQHFVFQRMQRGAFVLLQLNRSLSALRPDDIELLNSCWNTMRPEHMKPVHDWQDLGWSVQSNLIWGKDWPGYITKEFEWDQDFTDRIFLTSDFHKETQRDKPTRFFHLDPVSGALQPNHGAPTHPRN